MRLRAFLILFLMLSYATAPVLDVIACDDCAEPALSHRTAEMLQPWEHSAVTTAYEDDHASPSRGTAKDLCPLCANAVVAITPVKGSAPIETRECVIQPKLLAFIDPSYSIIKPPQN